MNEKILKSIQDLRKDAKKRNFRQTFDLIMDLREFDPKKPENKIDASFPLPRGRGKDANIVIFSDTLRTDSAKVLGSSEISALAKNKREAKRFANEADFLFGEPKLMPVVAKSLGTLLGPRGKIPKVLVGNPETLISEHKHATRVRVKDAPMIQCMVGTEDMDDEDVAENVEALVKFIESKLPGGRSNVSKIMLKLTMSKPVRLEVA